MEPVFAHGCAGRLILRFQEALSKKPFEALPSRDVNGKFGDATRAAVRLVQEQLGEPVTGTVNAVLWKKVTGGDWPEDFLRALQLLGAFEGHGYTKAAGNYDGAGMTWGIAGFTIVWSELVEDPKTKTKTRVYHHNSLHECLKRIFAQQHDVAVAAFGKERAKKLEEALKLTPAKLFEFAVSITDPKDDGVLVKEWQEGFALLGAGEKVRDIQDELAREWYWKKSGPIAKRFDDLGMDSEQMRQMCFELLVNPGAFTADRVKLARERIEKLPKDAPLPAKLGVIADLFVEKAATKNKADIRERKGTIANGYGMVHRKSYRLAGWGLDIAQPLLDKGLRLAILSFEESHVKEQLALADAATVSYVNPEAAVDLREWWPQANGTELVDSRTLSLRPLLRPAAASANEGGALATAMALTFQQPVGIFALFGQSPPLQGLRRRLVFGRGARGHAGLEMDAQGRLRLFVKPAAVDSEAQDSEIDLGDIRPSLAHCRLILLYCGNGIPSARGEQSAGALLREALLKYGGNPLVLGWFGNGGVPKDAGGRFLAPKFFQSLRKIGGKKTLEELVRDHEKQIVQAWGEACHEVFGISGPQKHLWRDGPFASLKSASETLKKFGLSGAAALGTDGALWHAREGYEGKGDAMAEVKA